jgi:hypothetical protein
MTSSAAAVVLLLVGSALYVRTTVYFLHTYASMLSALIHAQQSWWMDKRKFIIMM